MYRSVHRLWYISVLVEDRHSLSYQVVEPSLQSSEVLQYEGESRLGWIMTEKCNYPAEHLINVAGLGSSHTLFESSKEANHSVLHITTASCEHSLIMEERVLDYNRACKIMQLFRVENC